jgi:hypothetical protein
MAVLLVFILTGCAGSTMFGDEAPNIGADEFPSPSEHATDTALYLESLSQEYDSQPNSDYGNNDYGNGGETGLSQQEAAATVQAMLNDENYVETDPNGCPYGCDYHKQSCDIKGNISFDTKEKIYHVPGSDFYDSTVINTTYGEKWFCTEEEARNNGWRKAVSQP